MKRNYVFLAKGFEELEAVTIIDLLRRAGLCVELISAVEDSLEVPGAHGIVVKAEKSLDEVDAAEADWLLLPGGFDGTTNLAASEKVSTLLKNHAAAGGNIGAICAAPAIVLAPLGLLKGREATCYPGLEDKCVEGGAKMVNIPVVTDRNLITGNGPAAAIEFAAAVIAHALNVNVAREVTEGLLYNRDY